MPTQGVAETLGGRPWRDGGSLPCGCDSGRQAEGPEAEALSGFE